MTEISRPRKLKWLVLILVLTSLNANAQTYLCVGDEAVGFNKNGNNWQGTIFKEDGKFTLKREGSRWRWAQMGEKYGSRCPILKDDKGKEAKVLECNVNVIERLYFDESRLRFILVTPGGYIYPGLDSDSAAMRIGKCSPL